MTLVTKINLGKIRTGQSFLRKSAVERYMSLGTEEVLWQIAQYQKKGLFLQPYENRIDGEMTLIREGGFHLIELNHRCRALYELGVGGIILDFPIDTKCLYSDSSSMKLRLLKEVDLVTDEYIDEWCRIVQEEILELSISR